MAERLTHPTERLLKSSQMELELRVLIGFVEGEEPENPDKFLGAKREPNNKLNPLVTLALGLGHIVLRRWL